MAKNLVARVSKAGGDFELVDLEIPAPGPGEVRIKVKACGICFSDHMVKDGAWPGIEYPRVPGHEVAGVIDHVGAGVSGWKKGDRAGVGWHGGHDFVCPSCRRGDFVTCANEEITGVTRDGGYARYMLARQEALALRRSDPSATRTSSIFASLLRSKLSKKDTMSASRIQFVLPWCTIRSRIRTASWALRPGRKP